MRFLFTCGGTAGHVNPALAVAGEIRRLIPDAGILFIGSGRNMENRLIKREGYELMNISVTGFARGLKPSNIVSNLKTIKNLFVSSRQVSKILRSFRPDVAVGTGGYVCYPVLKKAAVMGIPTVIHESNAVPGLTTKMLSDQVTNVLVAFQNVSALYKKPERVVFTGTPVRGQFGRLSHAQEKRRLGFDGKPLVVSFWGSLGASKMNAVMADFIRLNATYKTFHHIHATGGGEAGLHEIEERLAKMNVSVEKGSGIEIRPYIDDMAQVMTAADLVICRAGASTIAELTMLGKPSILIPSPNVTNDHQLKNATFLAQAGGAMTVQEQSCTGEVLFETVRSLTADPDRLSAMAKASGKIGAPDATQKIVQHILSLCPAD